MKNRFYANFANYRYQKNNGPYRLLHALQGD